MGHSPTDMHTHDMLVFFLPLVVGPELAPPVHVYFSLPVLYLKYDTVGHTSGVIQLVDELRRSSFCKY